MLFINSEDSTSVSKSIQDTLKQVMQQVEYRCFADAHSKRIDPLYKELCLVAAEVFLMNPDTVIKVNASPISMRLVQDVYTHLRCDHLRFVLNNFQNLTYHVYNKKAYLRTALYNAVFELESHYAIEEYCPTD